MTMGAMNNWLQEQAENELREMVADFRSRRKVATVDAAYALMAVASELAGKDWLQMLKSHVEYIEYGRPDEPEALADKGQPGPDCPF
jgi:hypothetical protein